MSWRTNAAGAAAPATTDPDAPDLFRGGVLYRVARRFGVEPTTALRSARRGATLAALLWVPLAVLAVVEGVAVPGKVDWAFLTDVAAWIRPLVVVPLLLVAQPILAGAWRRAATSFRDRDLVPEDLRPAYAQAVERARRAAQHAAPEVVCFLLAASAVAGILVAVCSQPRETWIALPTGEGTSRLTLAGIWYGGVVHVVLLFLILRWIWLFVLWYRFLWGASRLPLRLHPTHPDRAAGLGFLGRTLPATAPLVFAWSASLAASVANRMIHHGARLPDAGPAGIGLAVVVLLVFVLPLVVIFGPLLARTRRAALEDLGRQMARQGDALGAAPGGSSPPQEPGVARSLEEFQIAVDAARAILPIPFPPSMLAGPLVAMSLPAVALLFLAFPAKEVLDQFLNLVF